MNQREAKAMVDHKRVKKDQAKAKEEQERVKRDLREIKHLQEQLRIDQANASAISHQEWEDMRKSFREQLQSIGEDLKDQFQAAQRTKKEIDVTSAIESVLQERAWLGRIPLPNSEEVGSEYDLLPPLRSERSGRGSIRRSRTTSLRGSSPPQGPRQQGGNLSGGRSSSCSSSDSELDRPHTLGDEISKLICTLRKKDSRNQVTKQPEAVFLGKAPKMREPETYEGCRESYVPWIKAVKEYMTVCSIDFRDDTTKIY
jgi:hypothetical protein